jgi:hypothetical protein
VTIFIFSPYNCFLHVVLKRSAWPDLAWKRQIALPPRKEQNKICDDLDAMSSELAISVIFLSQLQNLKIGLISDLLTGRAQVKLDKKSENAA